MIGVAQVQKLCKKYNLKTLTLNVVKDA